LTHQAGRELARKSWGFFGVVFFFLLHPATSAYILKYKLRGRFGKESKNIEVTELVKKRQLYLLDCSIVPCGNLRKEKGSRVLFWK